jgi:hypothetical protein
MQEAKIADSQCFTGDTQVLTPYGVCEIEYLDVGSMVLSRCEKTGKQGYRRVTKKFEHECEELCIVGYEKEDETRNGVATTAEHPFWVDGIGWVPAGELQAGQKLLIVDPLDVGGDWRAEDQKRARFIESGQLRPIKVVGTSRKSGVYPYGENDVYITPVYNIEVEEFHTYFVDWPGIWVHNKEATKALRLERTRPDKQPWAGFRENPENQASDPARKKAIEGQIRIEDAIARAGRGEQSEARQNSGKSARETAAETGWREALVGGPCGAARGAGGR